MDQPAARKPLTFDVICLSSINWNDPWQGQQEIMSRFAAAGAHVIYVENTGVRSPRLTDAARIARRLASWAGAREEGHRIPQGVTLVSPVGLPFPWSEISLKVNRRVVVRPIVQAAKGLRRPLIWCFLPTPTLVEAVKRIRPRSTAVIYYCVSDFATVAPNPIELGRSEDSLLKVTDVVFANGHTLAKRFEHRHSNVRIHPFGVNTAAFVQEGPEPADLAHIPKPRAGYVGGLHHHVAVSALEAAASALPEVSFVFVGPRQAGFDLGSLPDLDNVHILGAKPHHELPAYVRGFDVCLVPYRLSKYTESVVPTKLFEYMAVGKPVVTTALPELKWILEDGAAVLQAADEGPAFASALRQTLAAPPSQASRAVNVVIAQRFSWDRVFETMLEEIETSIGASLDE